MEKKRFGLVILVVSEGNKDRRTGWDAFFIPFGGGKSFALKLFSQPDKKSQPFLPAGFLQTLAAAGSQTGQIDPVAEKRHTQSAAPKTHKPFVFVGCCAPQTVVQMRCGQLKAKAAAQTVKQDQQSQGIGAAGNPGQNAAARRQQAMLPDERTDLLIKNIHERFAVHFSAPAAALAAVQNGGGSDGTRPSSFSKNMVYLGHQPRWMLPVPPWRFLAMMTSASSVSIWIFCVS